MQVHLLAGCRVQLTTQVLLLFTGGTAYLARETSRPTFLEFVSCTGNESNLLDCDRNGDVGLHTCTFGFFAEVECPRGKDIQVLNTSQSKGSL